MHAYMSKLSLFSKHPVYGSCVKNVFAIILDINEINRTKSFFKKENWVILFHSWNYIRHHNEQIYQFMYKVHRKMNCTHTNKLIHISVKTYILSSKGTEMWDNEWPFWCYNWYLQCAPLFDEIVHITD